MKKLTTFIISVLLEFICLFPFSGCVTSKAVTIKYLDDNYYAWDTPITYGYDRPIGFVEYEEEQQCIARSYRYARLMLEFHETPKGYKAIDIYKLGALTVAPQNDRERNAYMISRAGENPKEIEIIIWLQHMSNSNTLFNVKSLDYTYFDSILGQDVQTTIDLNYSFKIKERSVNYVGGGFEPKVIECNRQQLCFSIETDIDYDEIIYQVDRLGRYGETLENKIIVKEGTMPKGDSYTYASTTNAYYYYDQFSVVGYQKNGVKYYTWLRSFSLLDNIYN